MQFSPVAQQIPSLAKLRRRLVVGGEDSLRSVFLCGFERNNGAAAEMRFKDADEVSEFAMLESKLGEALGMLQASAPVRQVSGAEAGAPAGGAPGISAGAPAGAPGTLAGAPAGSPEASQPAKPADVVGAGTEAVVKTAEDNAKDEHDKAEYAKAKFRMDDVLVVCDRPPPIKTDANPPNAVGPLPAGTMFILPAPAHTRGRVAKPVDFKTMVKFGALTWMSDSHCILVGLGHDPSSFKRAKEKLEK